MVKPSTLKIPKGPFPDDHALANLAVALMVIHFFVLGHRDSWGGCRECQTLADKTLPKHRSLRNGNQGWDKKVLSTTDGSAFPALVRECRRLRARYQIMPIEGSQQGGDDVRVLQAAIDEGRGFPTRGDLAEFRCTPRKKDSQHSRGGGSKRGGSTAEPIESCARCMELATLVLEYGIYYKASKVPTGRSVPLGRLQAFAQYTMHRTNLCNLVRESIDVARVQHPGPSPMPAKPAADLPDVISKAIDEHPERSLDTDVYLRFLTELRYWAMNILDDSSADRPPFEKFAESVGLKRRDGIVAWNTIQDACRENPRAWEKLEFHALNHIGRRVSGESLTKAASDGSGTEIETPAFVNWQVQAQSDPLGMADQVFPRLDQILDSEGRRITTVDVANVLAEVLVEMVDEIEDVSDDQAEDGMGDDQAETLDAMRSEFFIAIRDGDIATVAESVEFQSVVGTLLADYIAYRGLDMDRDDNIGQ